MINENSTFGKGSDIACQLDPAKILVGLLCKFGKKGFL
jgi:hypothetical protein